MLKVDVEVVGGVAKTVRPKVWRKKGARFLGNVDADGAANTLDVFGDRKPPSPTFANVSAVNEERGIDLFNRPTGAPVNPLLNPCLFLGGKRLAVFGHFAGDHGFQQVTFRRVSGNDHFSATAAVKGSLASREVQLPIPSAGVMTFEAVFGQKRRNFVREEFGVWRRRSGQRGQRRFGVGAGLIVSFHFFWEKRPRIKSD